jgi:hypothetical protein
MSVVESYYTYAKLAGAAYVDLSNIANPTNPQVAADALVDQKRMSRALGEQMFGAGANTTPDHWTMLSPYYRSSVQTGHSDPASGFAGMLLSHPVYGKVLAIAGTEPDDCYRGQLRLVS